VEFHGSVFSRWRPVSVPLSALVFWRSLGVVFWSVSWLVFWRAGAPRAGAVGACFFGLGVGRLGGACAVVARSVGGPRRGRRCVFSFDGGCSRAARLRVAAAARRWRVRSCCAWFLLLWLGAGALRGAGARRVRFAGATCGRRAGCAFVALKFSNPRSRYDGDPVGRARLLCVCVFAPWSRFCVAACFSFCGFRVLKSEKSFYFFR